MELLNIKEYVKEEKEKLRRRGVAPSLSIVDATDGDVGNQIYIKKKLEDFEEMGWKAKVVRPVDKKDLYYYLKWSIDTDAVIVQMPVADRFEFNIEDLPSFYDADGMTKGALVMPATVRGIVDYLDACGFEYAGKNAVVMGRSEIVGKPMAKALTDRDMTVSLCHSKTDDWTKDYLLRNADLVVCATGRPHSVFRAQCLNAFVVDVGISRINGKIVGDFKEDSLGGSSTPVPGGVGLLTRLGLLKNCVDLKMGG